MSIAISFAGNVGNDPDLKYAQSGTAILGFSVATRSYDKQAGEQTTWLRCSLFGKRAESMGAHLKKGSSVFVRGSLRVREYEAQGEKRTSLDVAVDDVEFVGGKGGSAEQGDAPRRPTGGGPGRGRAPAPQAPSGGYADGYQAKQQDGGYIPDDSDIPF